MPMPSAARIRAHWDRHDDDRLTAHGICLLLAESKNLLLQRIELGNARKVHTTNIIAGTSEPQFYVSAHSIQIPFACRAELVVISDEIDQFDQSRLVALVGAKK